MKLNDAVFGAVFLVLSLLVLWTIQGYPKIPGQNVGPSAFPGAIAVGLAVCSLLLIRNGWRARASSPWFERGQWTRQPQQVIAFVVTFAALVLYVVASEGIGFLIVATVMLTAMMLAPIPWNASAPRICRPFAPRLRRIAMASPCRSTRMPAARLMTGASLQRCSR
jgi:putative tricarboxylic transport membrane protein